MKKTSTTSKESTEATTPPNSPVKSSIQTALMAGQNSKYNLPLIDFLKRHEHPAEPLTPVPIEAAPSPGVPNASKLTVSLRDMLESLEWRETPAGLPIALGKDIEGRPIVADLVDMPHLLIAGRSGSEKSVCINSIVTSLLYKFPPEQLRFVMIDAKAVELQQFNRLPHLAAPIVTDPKKIIAALHWVIEEMEKRYKVFAKLGVRNIRSFNQRFLGKPLSAAEATPLEDLENAKTTVIPDKLNYIVVLIEELADLMLVAPADTEMAIARITQMGRAAGIHCICATQRPSVDVVTGVIKSNMSTRIAFQVDAKIDSRTILDAMGAEQLLGKGDMLYLPAGSAKLIRGQGASITAPELCRIVDFITTQRGCSYDAECLAQLQRLPDVFLPLNDLNEICGLVEECTTALLAFEASRASLLPPFQKLRAHVSKLNLKFSML